MTPEQRGTATYLALRIIARNRLFNRPTDLEGVAHQTGLDPLTVQRLVTLSRQNSPHHHASMHRLRAELDEVTTGRTVKHHFNQPGVFDA